MPIHRIKKILTTALILCLMMSAAPSNMASLDLPTRFKDVSLSRAVAVNALAALGIVNGYPDGTFGETRDISRAEIVALILRLLQLEGEAKAKAGETPYSDVPSNNWASGYVNLATEMGLVEGDGNGHFLPLSNVKFEEAVKMAVIGAGYGEAAVTAGGWPDGYIKIARDMGFLSQIELEKGNLLNRGDAAQLLYQAAVSQLNSLAASSTPKNPR
ncbi:hypothetical protein FACS1894127_2880 [Clostridia bacterium]|nr:hypothetical protein FACS1894127_2880 [Clostridia bacterium]